MQKKYFYDYSRTNPRDYRHPGNVLLVIVTIKYIDVILFRIGSMEMIHDKRNDIANKMLNFWTLTPGRRSIEETLPQRQTNQTTLKYQSSKMRISPIKEGNAM